jgi:hypothetical protein
VVTQDILNDFEDSDRLAAQNQRRAPSSKRGQWTDVCELVTVLGAVDLGYRVIVVKDAVCNSFDEGHDALMKM